MNAWNGLLDLLKDLLEQLPSLLTILVLLVVAIVRWKRHPKVSLLASAGLTLLLLNAIVFGAVYAWVPNVLIESALTGNRDTVARNVYLILGLATNMSLAVALGLLLGAIFIQRPLTDTTADGTGVK
jgi:hypothetical protein